MQNFLFSLNVTLPIFIIIVVGGFLKRIGLLTEGFTSVADKFVFKVALPVQLFRDIAAMDIRADFSGKFVVFCMVATTCMFAATWILGAIFLKDKSMVGAFAQAAARGSAAILGIAFVENIYGDSGMTPMMIVAAVPLFNIYSVIILTVTSSEGKFNGALVKKLIKGVVTNPIILGIAAGMVWSLLRLPMPVILSKSVNYLATTATPLALLVLGATFKGREALSKIGPTIAAAMLKLVLIPAAIFPYGLPGERSGGDYDYAGVTDHRDVLHYGEEYGGRRYPVRQRGDDGHAAVQRDADDVGVCDEDIWDDLGHNFWDVPEGASLFVFDCMFYWPRC